jgi:hypothetical protein
MRLLLKHCRSAEKRLLRLGHDLARVRAALAGHEEASSHLRYWIPTEHRTKSKEELIRLDAKLTQQIAVAIEPVWVDVASSRYPSWRALAEQRPRIFRGPEAGLLPRLHRLVRDEKTARIALTLVDELAPEVKRRQVVRTHKPVWSEVPHLDAEMFDMIRDWNDQEGRSLASFLTNSTWTKFVEHVRQERLDIDSIGRRNLHLFGTCGGREFRVVPPEAFRSLARRFNNCAANGSYFNEASNRNTVMLASFDREASDLPGGMYWIRPVLISSDDPLINNDFHHYELRVAELSTIKDDGAPNREAVNAWLRRPATRAKLLRLLNAFSTDRVAQGERPSERVALFQSLCNPDRRVMRHLRHALRAPLCESDIELLKRVQSSLSNGSDSINESGRVLLAAANTAVGNHSLRIRAEKREQARRDRADTELQNAHTALSAQWGIE